MTVTEPEVVEEPKSEPKPDWWQRRYTFTGTAVGLVFLGLSLSPSLLPRGPLFQGLVSGAAGAVGYGLGVFAVWLVRFMLSRPSSPHPPRWSWPVLVAVGVVWLVVTIYWFHVWQDHVRDLMGVPRLQWYNYPQAAIIGVVILFLFVEIGQLVGRLVRYMVCLLNRYAPPRVSAVVVVVLLLSLTIAVLNGVIIRGGMSFLNSTFASVNDEMDPDNPAPKTRCAPAARAHWSRGTPSATRAARSSPVGRRSNS